MIADIGFKRQLWALDSELDVVWNWGKRKWEIWKFPGQAKKVVKKFDEQAHQVLTVQTKDRSFRELGADILLKLQWGDTTRWSLNELVNYFNQMDDNIQRAKEKQFENWCRDITKDTADWWMTFKSQVPRTYGVKPYEFEKYKLNAEPIKPNRYRIKLSTSTKVSNVVSGGNNGG